MSSDQDAWKRELDRDGYTIFRNVYSHSEVDRFIKQLEAGLFGQEDARASIRSRSGSVYAARNLMDVMPSCRTLWQSEFLVERLQAALGSGFGLVRGLYFDKHPDAPWSLPWHKDMTIAVERNDLSSSFFRNPTTKAGIAHVEAPPELLEKMLTLRIQLDDVTKANGPLKVIRGSHQCEEIASVPSGEIDTIVGERGDVLAMRPLLTHGSGNPAGSDSHRRTLHLEFCGQQELPDGFQWRNFGQPVKELLGSC